MHSEHAASLRTLGPNLYGRGCRVVAQGGATRNEVARNSGLDPSESGESQSPGNRTRTAQRPASKSPAPKLPTVYIAGPYRGRTASAIRRNIERAREAAEAKRLGIPVFTDEFELRAWITDRLVNARAIR